MTVDQRPTARVKRPGDQHDRIREGQHAHVPDPRACVDQRLFPLPQPQRAAYSDSELANHRGRGVHPGRARPQRGFEARSDQLIGTEFGRNLPGVHKPLFGTNAPIQPRRAPIYLK